MVVKVYISGISGNKEVKKRQQRVLMILDSKSILYEVVDITDPGKEPEKDYMQTKSTSSGATVNDTNPRHPLPPQLFNDSDYCGDYDEFDLANEIDTLEQFLKVELPKEEESVATNENGNQKEEETAALVSESGTENPTESNTETTPENAPEDASEKTSEKTTENAAETASKNVTETAEKVESNGVASSREASVEAEKKSNGEVKADAEENEKEEAEEEEEEEEVKDKVVEPVDLKKDLTPSEDLIKSEQGAAE